MEVPTVLCCWFRPLSLHVPLDSLTQMLAEATSWPDGDARSRHELQDDGKPDEAVSRPELVNPFCASWLQKPQEEPSRGGVATSDL